MDLGAFSISLTVSNLVASRDFYRSLGFEVFGGGEDMNYLIMKNGDSLIGLFEAMFDQNILTFNPGWDTDGAQLAEFDDVRTIQSNLDAAGIELVQRIGPDDSGSGPASIVVTDPDGNTILIDQHV